MSERKPEEQRISSVPPFGLRMLPDLRQRVEDAARESGRSMNAEIIARLEETFARRDRMLARTAALEAEGIASDDSSSMVMYEILRFLRVLVEKEPESKTMHMFLDGLSKITQDYNSDGTMKAVEKE